MSEAPRVPCIVSFQGKEIEAPGGELLLEVLERAGAGIESLCRGGTCGTCRVRLVRGAPAIESLYALRKEQREEGWILSCCARTVPGQRIVLEL